MPRHQEMLADEHGDLDGLELEPRGIRAEPLQQYEDIVGEGLDLFGWCRLRCASWIARGWYLKFSTERMLLDLRHVIIGTYLFTADRVGLLPPKEG